MNPPSMIYRAYARVYPDGHVTRTPVRADIPESVTEPALTRLVNHSHPVPPTVRYPKGYYKVGFVGPDAAEVEAAVAAAVELAKRENA